MGYQLKWKRKWYGHSLLITNNYLTDNYPEGAPLFSGLPEHRFSNGAGAEEIASEGNFVSTRFRVLTGKTLLAEKKRCK